MDDLTSLVVRNPAATMLFSGQWINTEKYQ